MSVRASNTTVTPLPDAVEVRHVTRLAWPLVVSMLSYTVMGVVDTAFVAQLGTAHLAAIGLALATFFVVHGFGNGVITGVKIAISQSTGAEEHDKARRLAWQGLALAALIGVFEAALWPLGDVIFPLFGASDAVASEASDYFAVRVLGGPVAFGMFALSAYFQGRGETTVPMVATLIANALNIALDPLFIFGIGPFPEMGTEGAALATVISFGAGFSYLAYRAWPRLIAARCGPDRALMRWVWSLGFPLGVRAALEVGSYTILTAILAGAGDADLAAHVLVIRIISVSFLPGYGIGEATAILTGQAIGAGRRELVSQTWRAATVLAVSVMAACGVLFITLPSTLTALFEPAADVAAIAYELMLVAAAFQVFDAVLMVAQGVLGGASDTRFVMWSSVVTAWCVKIPLAYVLAIPVGWGAAGAWLGLTAEIVVISVITVWRARKLGFGWAFAPLYWPTLWAKRRP